MILKTSLAIAATLMMAGAAYADPIIYTGAGLDGATITGTKYDVAADAFQGAGSTARRVWFEVQQGDLPQAPAKRKPKAALLPAPKAA